MILAGIALTITIAGCKKKEAVDPTNNPGTTNNYTSFDLPESYGVLVAIKSFTYQEVGGFQVPVELKTASATFVSSPGSKSFIDAGQVTLTGKGLTKQSNNAYIYQDLLNPLSFNPVSWTVSGGNGIPMIDYTDNKSWPSFGGYNTLPATVIKTQGLTVSLNSSVSNADSVYLIVASSDGKYAISRTGGNAAEITLSASDLTALTSGTGGMIQVTPWSFDKEDFNSKDFYFILEAVYSKMNITIN